MPIKTKAKTDVEKITGAVDLIRYNEGGFLVARLDTGVTVVGNMLEPLEGQEYDFHGRWDEHPKFGRQFKFDSYSANLPKSTDGIIRYLVRVAKWVKTARARKIVDLYGEDTLEILKSDPARVAKDIRGITPERALEVQEFLRKNEMFEAAVVAIEGYVGKVRGLPRNLATQLLKAYGTDAVDVIKKDPYVLTRFHRIGFALADSVALLNGFAKDAIERKAAAIIHVLQAAGSEQGHTCLPQAEATLRVRGLIGQNAEEAYPYLKDQDRIAYLDDGDVMLGSLDHDERSISGIVRALLETPLETEIPVPLDGLAEDQIAAVEILRGHRLGILTGPPGSGKTYLFARIVRGLKMAGFSPVVLCAPTGKAAQRMTESLQDVLPGAQASTIHRALGPSMDPKTEEFSFTRGVGNPLQCKALVVDETSMLDTSLAARLLEATTPDMVVLFIGDHYQLPSIGPGAVLKDLSRAGVPTARLETIKRNTGQIVRSCHQIKDGKPFDWSPRVDLDNGANFRHIREKSGEDIIARIVWIATEKVPELGLDPFWDFQALTPMNTRSAVSCQALNDALSMALNPGKNIEGLEFRVGDKVVRLKNAVIDGMHDRDFFDEEFDTDVVPDDLDPVEVVNGDVGKVVYIGPIGDKKPRIIVHFGSPHRLVYFPRIKHHLQRAYAMTCHKLQGSDAPVVVIPLHRSFGTRITTRSWIYTAISRAKTLCLTVGDRQVGLDMVRRTIAGRRTKLVERVCGQL